MDSKDKKITTSRAINLLLTLCPVFDAETARNKEILLNLLAEREIRAPHLLKKYHASLCYLRAFPDNRAIYQDACNALEVFGGRTRELDSHLLDQLEDSGIVETRVCYPFSYASLVWLTPHFGDALNIDWENSDPSENIATLVPLLTNTAEQAALDDGLLSVEEYLQHSGRDEADLLVHMCQHQHPENDKLVEHMYDSCDVQLTWELKEGWASRTHNYLKVPRIYYRRNGMRKLDGPAKAEIARPMRTTHLSATQGATLLDIANAALLVRSREVYHFQHASPDAIYLASAGEGVQIAFLGAVPGKRFSLDVSFGYMVFSNGIPLAYGGVSPLFSQGNTGLNVLDEYRKGESAYLYTQVLRMAHSLFGCKRFIVNPYQFGADNTDALQSGAFWFYYRLGFRPVAEAVARLAKKEFEKLGKDRSYRPSLKVLKRLVSCDIHLVLPEAERIPVFEEDWLSMVALGATGLIARQDKHHQKAIKQITSDIVAKLGIKDLASWTKTEREQLRRLAPVCGLIEDLDNWPSRDKNTLTALIRAKGGLSERRYAQAMSRHSRFFSSLMKYCRGQK